MIHERFASPDGLYTHFKYAKRLNGDLCTFIHKRDFCFEHIDYKCERKIVMWTDC